jgi:F0F1-type ATP synthase membrane subunit c/vacuolar-type H+-ATPase subunit K
VTNIALVLIFGLCILGPSIVFAFGNAASINALARNLLAAPKIFTGLIVRLVAVEALAIFVMMFALSKFA